MMNICLAPVVYPVVITAWSILLVVGMYTGIRLYSVLPLPMYALFVVLAVDGFLVINFVLKECGIINEKSEMVLENFKLAFFKQKSQNSISSLHLLQRKQLRSLCPLRIKMGSCNFFEVSTPLEVLSICLDSLVSLLLAT